MKVILMCAISLDGKIARSGDDPIDWTGSEDKKHFAEATKKAGVVIMGNNTYKAMGKPLKDRLNVVMTTNLADKTNIPNVIEYVSKSPEEVLEDLAARGFKEAFVVGGSQINALFWKHRLINELWLTIAPVVFGQGINLFGEIGVSEVKLALIEKKQLAGDLLLVKYRV